MKPSRSNTFTATKAFSLLELMLALAIFAMVLTAIYASWSGILRASKIGSEAAADIQRSRIAMQTIEDALSCAQSYQADIQHYSFLGENGREASLSFVARLPDEFPRSGKFGDFDVRRVTFALQPGPDSVAELVLRQNPILRSMDEDEMEHPLVLARNVKDFVLQFWDPTANDWTDEWTQTNQLPRMVQVALSFNGADSTKPLSTVIRTVSLPSVMVQAAWQRPVSGRASLGAKFNPPKDEVAP